MTAFTYDDEDATVGVAHNVELAPTNLRQPLNGIDLLLRPSPQTPIAGLTGLALPWR